MLAEKEELVKHLRLEVSTLRTGKQNSDAALTKLQDDVAAHKKRHHEAVREKAQVEEALHAVEIGRRAEVCLPAFAPPAHPPAHMKRPANTAHQPACDARPYALPRPAAERARGQGVRGALP